MKNQRRCTKCGSCNVVRVKGNRQGYGVGDNIMAGVFDQILVTKYVCCECGYIEEWLDDLSKTEKIKNYQDR